MAVPNTTTFTLEDVCDDLGLTGTNRTLSECLRVAPSSGYNSSYSGGKNSLYNFRGYNNTSNTDTLTVTPRVIDSVGQGEAHSVTVTSNTTWVVSESESWISISGASNSGNDTFSIITSNNGTGQDRTGSVTISTGSTSRTVVVNQTLGFA